MNVIRLNNRGGMIEGVLDLGYEAGRQYAGWSLVTEREKEGVLRYVGRVAPDGKVKVDGWMNVNEQSVFKLAVQRGSDVKAVGILTQDEIRRHTG